MNRNTFRKELLSQVCGTTRRAVLRRAIIVRPAVVQLIQREMGHWDENGWICLDDLQRFQYQYVQSLLEAEKGELTKLELEVLNGLKEHEILASNPELNFEANLTLGQRFAPHRYIAIWRDRPY